MCNKHHSNGPNQCIIPPHMFEAIQANGSNDQQSMAQGMHTDANSFRDNRQKLAPVKTIKSPKGKGSKSQAAQIEVYDANNTKRLPGKLQRKNGDQANSDVTVNQAFEGSEAVYDLYSTVYGRDSIDGNGLSMKSTVHYDRKYNNAFWNGEQMVYGDGDGIFFSPLTGDLTIIGHELSHGVVQFSGGLNYNAQSGALNESFADVFGSIIAQHKQGLSTSEASWVVGAKAFTPDIKGDALRSLKAPGTAYDDPIVGKDIQPAHMRDYNHTSSDNYGVHINSGIPNHAFYLLCQHLGGNSWDKAGHIWYDAMQNINNPDATFVNWADETMIAARELFGAGSKEEAFLKQAWQAVGVY